MTSTQFEKRASVGLLCSILLLTSSLFAVLDPAPAYSWPSPRLFNGHGQKPHPADSRYHGETLGESRFQPGSLRTSTVDASVQQDVALRMFPGWVPVLSLALILGFLIILRIGTVHRRG